MLVSVLIHWLVMFINFVDIFCFSRTSIEEASKKRRTALEQHSKNTRTALEQTLYPSKNLFGGKMCFCKILTAVFATLSYIYI